MSDPSDNPLKRLIGEIHRRSLWQVLGIYAVSGIAIYQVVQSLTEGVGLPDWFPQLAFILLLIGLPIVLATAFVQQGGPAQLPPSPSGTTMDELYPTATEPTVPSRLFTWRNAILGGVGAFALLGFVGTGWVLFGGGLPVTSGGAEALRSVERSVAVLPFVNMSGNPDNEYFSDGITEELLNALAQLPELRVPARTSSFAFKGQNIPIQEIAESLGVANVLEGSVRRDGERVLITAQLVEAGSGFHLWSDTFERELEDIFAIQREIAAAIAGQLQITLSGEQQTRLVADATDNTEAYEAYLRGRYLWTQRTAPAMLGAITEFERAIALDPEYAEAYAGLAESYALVDNYVSFETGAAVDRRTNYERGLSAARTAVSLGPELGMTHSSLGLVLRQMGEWEDSAREFERAIELNPGYASAHQFYATLLWATGRSDEALGHAERSFELDPVSPIISRALGTTLQVAGRTQEAIEQYRRTAALSPNRAGGNHLYLSMALLEAGEYEEGTEAWLPARPPNVPDVEAWVEIYHAMIRYRETGESQAVEVPVGGSVGMWLSDNLGQADRVIEALEDVVRQGAFMQAAQAHAAVSDPIRDDPRYQALLEEAGITW